jgi:CBS-domain-containing membrane protein
MKPSGRAQVPEDDATALSVLWDGLFAKESKGLAEKPVKDIMVPARYYVEPEDPITKAAYLMIHHDLILLPVLEKRKKFVGLVRMTEVFDEISGAILEQ